MDSQKFYPLFVGVEPDIWLGRTLARHAVAHMCLYESRLSQSKKSDRSVAIDVSVF